MVYFEGMYKCIIECWTAITRRLTNQRYFKAGKRRMSIFLNSYLVIFQCEYKIKVNDYTYKCFKDINIFVFY